MIFPERRPIMLSTAYFVTNIVPLRFVSSTAWSTLERIPCTVSRAATPALLTNTSITPPNSASALPTAAATSLSSRMSHDRGTAIRPRSSIAAAAAASMSGVATS